MYALGALGCCVHRLRSQELLELYRQVKGGQAKRGPGEEGAMLPPSILPPSGAPWKLRVLTGANRIARSWMLLGHWVCACLSFLERGIPHTFSTNPQPSPFYSYGAPIRPYSCPIVMPGHPTTRSVLPQARPLSLPCCEVLNSLPTCAGLAHAPWLPLSLHPIPSFS